MIGETLAHYRIVERLGKGGMGEVYVAEDTRLGRRVALKVLPPEMAADPERLARFEREARAVAALNHPNIVTIHSIEQHGGVRFLTMELVRGRPLSERIPRQGMALAGLLDLAVPIADAVAAAHQRGVTHRDLKPDNIMVTDEGVPKVLDFGLAKLAAPPQDSPATQAATLAQTAEGKVFGTLAYMSPEQAQGKPVDPRSDVFSLGIVLYEMAAGVRPFQGENGPSILASILKDDPRPITEVNRALPRHLGRILRLCLAKDPLRRYQTAIDLRNDLEELKREAASGELETAPAAPRAARRTGQLVIAGLLAVAALAAAILFLLLRARTPAAAPFRARLDQITDSADLENFPSLSPDGRFVAYEGRPEGGTSDVYLLRVGGRNPINLTRDFPGDDGQPAFSPEGERIAFRSDREGGGLFVMGATGESVRRLTAAGFHPAWSPDGRRLAFCTESVDAPFARSATSQLWVVDVESGESRRISTADAVHPRWSPGGARIAYWGLREGGQRDLWTMPVEGGDPVPVTEDPPVDWSPVWSPDGRHLYFSSDRGGNMNLWRVPIDERTGALRGSPEPVTTGSGGDDGGASISADGLRIAYVTSQTHPEILRAPFDAREGALLGEPAPVPGLPATFAYATPSPDGRRLALSNVSARQEDIFVAGVDGTGLSQLTDDHYKDRLPRWTPEGDRIVFYSDRSGGYEIWSIRADGSDLRQLTDTPDVDAIYPVLSPDGRRIIYQDVFERRAWMFRLDVPWDEQQPEALDGLRGPDGWVAVWSWSADGRRLAGGFRDEQGREAGIGTYSLESGELRRWTDFGEGAWWLPDGRRLLFGAEGRGLFLLDTAGGAPRQIAPEPGFLPPGSIQLSPDGGTLYFTRIRIEADLWMLTLEP
jgi:Tol biopolymer transport system component